MVLKGSPLERTVRRPTHRRRPARALLALGLVGLSFAGALLPGCAGTRHPAAESPAVSPAPALSAEPALPPTLNLTELESLEHDLQQSEERLDAELARKNQLANASPPPPPEAPVDASRAEPKKSADSVGSGAAVGTTSRGAAGAPARGPRAPTPESSPPPAGPAVEAGDRGSPCDLGCRALASMQRAQARICEIAGPGPRCQAAIERVEAAAERVRAAGCECLPTENG